MENKFKEWLDSKGIYYVWNEEDNSFAVNDYSLRPYESEVKEILPSFQFIWEVQPNKRSS